MSEDIRKYKEGMAYESSGNIIAELRKRSKFGGFSEDRMQYVLEGECNKACNALNDELKTEGQLEECYD